MSIKEFLEKSGVPEKLVTLLGEAIPQAVILIRRAIASQKGELAGSENVYGEKQLALDVQANDIVLAALKASGVVTNAASEEMEESVEVGTPADGNYSVAFDPLDGSSLVDVNFAVGSIFGIYEGEDFVSKKGQDQVAACYAVYGPHTTIMLTTKKGTHEFKLQSNGKFSLSREKLTIAPEAKHFAPGNLRAAAEREDYLKLTNEYIKRGLTLRYSGGMVPDVHHILVKGNGIFTYPGYSKAPQGKLRLLFEANPMALLIEEAGGTATDGKKRLLEKSITELHERTPVFLGSKKDVEEVGKKLNN